MEKSALNSNIEYEKFQKSPGPNFWVVVSFGLHAKSEKVCGFCRMYAFGPLHFSRVTETPIHLKRSHIRISFAKIYKFCKKIVVNVQVGYQIKHVLTKITLIDSIGF